MLPRMPLSSYLKQKYKLTFPTANVFRCSEPIATNEVFSDTPPIDGGEKSAFIYIVTKFQFADAYAVKTSIVFVNT